MIKVVFFDFNDTLMKTATPKIILNFMGKNHQLKTLKDKYIKGNISKRESSKKALSLYKGFTLNNLDTLISEKQFAWNNNVKECLNALHTKGIKNIIVTNEDFTIIQHLCREMPVDMLKCSELEIKDEKFTGKFITIINSKSKIVADTLNELGFRKEEAIAVGDSPDDAEMFQAVGIGVLYNPDTHTKGMGDYEITDFMELMKIIDNKNKKEKLK